MVHQRVVSTVVTKRRETKLGGGISSRPVHTRFLVLLLASPVARVWPAHTSPLLPTLPSPLGPAHLFHIHPSIHPPAKFMTGDFSLCQPPASRFLPSFLPSCPSPSPHTTPAPPDLCCQVGHRHVLRGGPSLPFPLSCCDSSPTPTVLPARPPPGNGMPTSPFRPPNPFALFRRACLAESCHSARLAFKRPIWPRGQLWPDFGFLTALGSPRPSSSP